MKKLKVFHKVANVSRKEASIAPRLVRVDVHGEPCENIHQRNGSAPRVFNTSHGSMTLPTDLLIFLPLSSTMWPRHNTCSKGLVPKTRVFTASRV